MRDGLPNKNTQVVMSSIGRSKTRQIALCTYYSETNYPSQFSVELRGQRRIKEKLQVLAMHVMENTTEQRRPLLG